MPEQLELPPHLGEVLAARRAQVVGDLRQRRRSPPGPRAPCESSTRSGFVSARRWLSAQSVDAIRAQRRAQLLDVRRPAARVAHGVQHAARGSVTPQASRKRERHLDRPRRRPSGSRSRRPRRPPGGTGGSGPSAAARAGTSARSRRRAARGPCCTRLCSITARTMPAVASGRSVSDVAVAVLEGVHLLRDDVGLGADAAREELGLLEDRACGSRGSRSGRRARAPPPRCGARPAISSGRMSRVPVDARGRSAAAPAVAPVRPAVSAR